MDLVDLAAGTVNLSPSQGQQKMESAPIARHAQIEVLARHTFIPHVHDRGVTGRAFARMTIVLFCGGVCFA